MGLKWAQSSDRVIGENTVHLRLILASHNYQAIIGEIFLSYTFTKVRLVRTKDVQCVKYSVYLLKKKEKEKYVTN